MRACCESLILFAADLLTEPAIGAMIDAEDGGFDTELCAGSFRPSEVQLEYADCWPTLSMSVDENAVRRGVVTYIDRETTKNPGHHIDRAGVVGK